MLNIKLYIIHFQAIKQALFYSQTPEGIRQSRFYYSIKPCCNFELKDNTQLI